MNKILTLIKNINKKIFLFIFLLLPFYSSVADEFILNSEIRRYPKALVYTKYIGPLPLPNGQIGEVVEGCSRWTNGRCNNPANVWGEGFIMPGGVFNITSLNHSVRPGGYDKSDKCYFRGAWHLSNNEGSFFSQMLRKMNSTVSEGVWTSAASTYTVVTPPLIINKRCSEITNDWISKSGTPLTIPASTISVYANIFDGNNYSGALEPASGMQGSGHGASFLLLRYATWFQYTSLICTSETISNSTCMLGDITNDNIGLVEQLPSVKPKECSVDGSSIIDIKSVSKSDYAEASGKVDMNVKCNADATVEMELVHEKLSNNGIDIKMSINNKGTKEEIQLKEHHSVTFSINAEVTYISPSTDPGEYKMNNVLVVSYK